MELTQKEKWYASMREKLKTDDDGVREFMRASSEKSKKNKGGTGGFAHMAKHNPDKLKQVATLGGSRKKK